MLPSESELCLQQFMHTLQSCLQPAVNIDIVQMLHRSTKTESHGHLLTQTVQPQHMQLRWQGPPEPLQTGLPQVQ